MQAGMIGFVPDGVSRDLVMLVEGKAEGTPDEAWVVLGSMGLERVLRSRIQDVCSTRESGREWARWLHAEEGEEPSGSRGDEEGDGLVGSVVLLRIEGEKGPRLGVVAGLEAAPCCRVVVLHDRICLCPLSGMTVMVGVQRTVWAWMYERFEASLPLVWGQSRK